jgi:TctA family transporter
MDTALENFSPGVLLWQTLTILAVVLPILAIIDIMNNDFKDNNKLFWVLVILFTSLIGVLLYYKYGTKQKIAKV